MGRGLKWLSHLEKGTQTDSAEKEGCKMVAERPLMELAEMEPDRGRFSPTEEDRLSKESYSERQRLRQGEADVAREGDRW